MTPGTPRRSTPETPGVGIWPIYNAVSRAIVHKTERGNEM